MRSKRRPLESRKGKRVGDPGTTGARIGYRTGSGSDWLTSARPTRGTAARSHHARVRARAAEPPVIGDDQFIQNFFYWAFLRYPNSTELAYWNDILRTAYPQGQSAMLAAMRELGMTVFESAEYAARNRSNHDYVYDLYKTFLMRDPDSGGWAYWESVVPQIGRENVRHGFEYSVEFSNLVASVTPNGSASGNAASLLTARVDPNNQTGDQLLARDCEWSVGLLNLPGRAGLDLGLGLSYSSLVWTRSGPYLYFDADNGSPSPGFRLGFATIQGAHFDAQLARNVYMLITSSGHRVELRQIGTSNVYEAGDSSYLQLIDNGGSLLVRTTDGTQMTYLWFENEWRATQIKDRNGNYLTVNYNSQADITNITDTLGRVITFNYDANANPVSITQSWNGQTHTWATFGWGTLTMQLGFSGASVVGTYNGEAMPVLTQVGLDDGSFFTFQYTGAGQVNLIRSYAPNSAQRSYVAYDYAPATDNCPRLSQTRVWAQDWTGVNGVPAEVVTQYSDPGDGSHQLVAPDGTVYKEFYGGTGVSPVWQRGLVLQTEVWSGGVRQKWTTTAWTQDNTGVSYQTNPRVTETNIYDSAGNRNRSTMSYTAFTLSSGASCSLPSDAYQYAADAATVLRRSHTDYNLSATYLDRRIIGLAASQTLFDGANNLMARTDLLYDEVGSVQNQGATTQHDDTNYGSGLVAGRANVSSARRYDVINSGQWTVSSVQYNTAGAVVTAIDPAGHQTTIGYTDSFSDSVNRNTFAYPTTVTDADGFSSYLQYNYDFGARTRVQGPPPAGQSQGVIQTFAYDSVARIQQVTTTNNGAYTRYVYGWNYVQSFSTVNNVADEAYAIQVLDGVGRVIGAGGNHPGSAGGYSAVNTLYDVMGRVMKQSNPTEINSAWIPAGDDAAGFVYTQQTYDWKGRPLVTTNTDGTQKSASYDGCGCAGGEVVTLTDEVGRQQKVYSDVLGRTAKAEVLNWNSTVYSTTANTYNARDQVTLVRQYQGAENGSGTYQDTTMSYDGYGRLQSKRVPEQNAGTATVYAYNADDTVSSVTDARGASATYGYNGRHLVTGITYSAPAGITPTSNISLGYDGAGNRTSMTDGLGSQSYTYDSLSRMTSETRYFSALGQWFTLSYDYNLAGELKRITDATNMTINYGFDSTGRLSSVTGSDNLFIGISSYASNFQYRAWGGLKAMTDGSGHTSSLLYNSKLQPTHFNLSSGQVSQNYSYHNDGRLSFVQNTTDANFDRSYFYDHAARLSEAKSGGRARGDLGASPYYESFAYDAFSNLTGRETDNWDQEQMFDGATYTNNRRTGWGYDSDGRNITIGTRNYSFDADGQARSMTGQRWVINHYVSFTQTMVYDGDGEKLQETLSGQTTYYLRSSALDGEIVEELNSSGLKTIGYVYSSEGQMLARQSVAGSNSYITWKRSSPAGTGEHDYNVGYVFGSGSPQRVELDPLGAGVPLEYTPPPEVQNEGDVGQIGGIMDSRWSNFFDLSGGCAKQGVMASCSGSMLQVNLEAEMYAAFGNRVYDLPGFHDERALGESIYIGMVQRTIAAYREAQQAKKKPKPPKLKPQPKKRPSKKEIERRRKENAGVGNNESEPQNPLPGPKPAPGPDPTEHYPLTPCNKSRLAPYFPGVDLDKVQIRFGFDSLTKFTGGVLNAVGIQVLNGATAITVGNVITFRSRSDYNPDSLNPFNGIGLIGHEITHVGQYQAGRFGDFQYVREYLNNRALGMSDYEAYQNIGVEREAFKMERMILRDLQNLKRQLGGDSFWAPCPPH